MVDALSVVVLSISSSDLKKSISAKICSILKFFSESPFSFVTFLLICSSSKIFEDAVILLFFLIFFSKKLTVLGKIKLKEIITKLKMAVKVKLLLPLINFFLIKVRLLIFFFIFFEKESFDIINYFIYFSLIFYKA